MYDAMRCMMNGRSHSCGRRDGGHAHFKTKSRDFCSGILTAVRKAVYSTLVMRGASSAPKSFHTRGRHWWYPQSAKKAGKWRRARVNIPLARQDRVSAQRILTLPDLVLLRATLPLESRYVLELLDDDVVYLLKFGLVRLSDDLRHRDALRFDCVTCIGV